MFVFAITQVSHLLLEHLTWTSVLQSLIVLFAVYWSWNYTTWTTNELDTETVPVRLLLLGLMLVSLLMSVAMNWAWYSKFPTHYRPFRMKKLADG